MLIRTRCAQAAEGGRCWKRNGRAQFRSLFGMETMRVLTNEELATTSGGVASKIAYLGDLFAIIHEGGVAGVLVGASAFAGTGIGLGFNYVWEQATGNSPGGSLYDWVNSD